MRKIERAEAIRNYCLDCSDNKPVEAKKCNYTQCGLFPYRSKAKKAVGLKSGGSRKKVIHKYCLHECMNGHTVEVKNCTSAECPLYNFRR